MRTGSFEARVSVLACCVIIVFQAGAAELPDFRAEKLAVTNSIVAPPFPFVDIAWQVSNQGNVATTVFWYDSLFLSSQPVLDGTETRLSDFLNFGPVQVGGSYWRTNTFQLPITKSGWYYLILKADGLNNVAEGSEDNNTIAAPVTFTSTPPDLVPTILAAPASLEASPNTVVNIAWKVENQGMGAALGVWYDFLYFSTNSFLNGTEQFLGISDIVGPLPPGGSYWATNGIRLPHVGSGEYFILAQVNGYRNVIEINTNNDVLVSPIHLSMSLPDLKPFALQVPAIITGPPWPQISAVWGVTNHGRGNAVPFSGWLDNLYISTNNTPNDGIQLTSVFKTETVLAGATYWQTNMIQLPVAESGTYYLILKVNEYGQLAESDQSNNELVVPITCNITKPDLVALPPPFPTTITGAPNPTLNFVWGVTNQGTGSALGYWNDAIRLFTNASLQGLGIPLEGEWQTGPVFPGTSYWHTNSIRMPVVASGTYYLSFQADTESTLIETTRTNNTAVVPVTFEIYPPDLVPLASQVPNIVTSSPNPTLTVVWGTTNQGVGAASVHNQWYDYVYFSTDSILDGFDVMVALRGHGEQERLAPGQSWIWTNEVSLPVRESGTHYLIFASDDYDDVYESDETNNRLAVPINFEVQKPDLAPLVFHFPAVVTGPPYPTVTFEWSVTNQGVGAAVSAWSDMVYFSTNGVVNGNATPICYGLPNVPVRPGEFYTATNSGRIPVSKSGAGYFIFKTDPSNSAYESDTNNNDLIVPVTLNILPPDLRPVEIAIPSAITIAPNQVLAVATRVVNQGSGSAIGYSNWRDGIYFSTNGVFDQTALELGSWWEAGPVEPGASYWRTNQLRLPVLNSGNFYLHLKVDIGSALVESDDNNNILTIPLAITLVPSDLAPIGFQAPTNLVVPPRAPISFSFGVTNQGLGTAISPYYSYYHYYYYWTDRIYLSTSNGLGANDWLLAEITRFSPLEAGGSYWQTYSGALPAVTNGTYYFILQCDAPNAVYESNESNNLTVVRADITILPPDLVPLALQVANDFTGPPNPWVLFSWGVTNQGTGAARPTWVDAVYLSSSSNLDSTAIRLFAGRENDLVAGGSYWRTNAARVPVTNSGTFYFIFQTDFEHELLESDNDNNFLAIPATFHINPPDLEPVFVQAPRVVHGAENPILTVSYGITNQGSGVAQGVDFWRDALFISTNSVRDGSEIEIDYRYETGPVAATNMYWRTATVRAPVSKSGNYYLLLGADTDGQLFESNETNNVHAIPITFDIQSVDLAAMKLIAPTVVNGGMHPEITLVWGVTNFGAGVVLGNPTWTDEIFLSSDTNLDFQDIGFASTSEEGPIAPHGSYWRSVKAKLPVTTNGDYYLIFKTDAYGSLPEDNQSNNVIITPLRARVALPDLAPLELRAPTLVNGKTNDSHIWVHVVWGITNHGPGAVDLGFNEWPQYAYDTLYVSRKPVLDDTAILLMSGFEPGFLAAGGTHWQTNWVSCPVAGPGDYFLILQINNGSFPESNFSNNIAVMPFRFNVVTTDLAPIAFEVTNSVVDSEYPYVTLVWGVTNFGPNEPASTYGYWYDVVFLSTNSVRDGTELAVGGLSETEPIAPGESYWRTNVAQLPVAQSGSYYLIFDVDAWGYLGENTISNNTLSRPFTYTLRPADLKPIDLEVQSVVSGPPNTTFKVVYGVTNQGSGDARGGGSGWLDVIYLSTNASIEGSIFTLSQLQETNQVSAGGSYWRTNEVPISLTESGTWYLVFKANAYNFLQESNLQNNVAAVPVTFEVQLPDLVPLALIVTNRVIGGPEPRVEIVAGVTNRGSGPAIPNDYWWDSLYLSTTPFPGGPTTAVRYWERRAALQPGDAYWITNVVQMPVSDSGTYYLFFETVGGSWLIESDEANNSIMSEIRFELSAGGNLVATKLTAPRVVTDRIHTQVKLEWRVANLGLGPVSGLWSDTVYLASEPYLPSYFPPLTSVVENRVLASGSEYSVEQQVTLPEVKSGNYYLILVANSGSEYFESDFADNRLAVPVLIDNESPSGLRIGKAEPLSTGGFQLEVFGQLDLSCELQASTNLVDWSKVMDFVCVSWPGYVNDAQSGNFARRFYRIALIADTQPPLLSISSTSGQTVTVSWDLPADGWQLEQTVGLGANQQWVPVSGNYQTDTTKAWLTLGQTNATTFYRLHKP